MVVEGGTGMANKSKRSRAGALIGSSNGDSGSFDGHCAGAWNL
jgi:hypothetical protein